MEGVAGAARLRTAVAFLRTLAVSSALFSDSSSPVGFGMMLNRMGRDGSRLIDSCTCRDDGRERIRFGGTTLDVGGTIDDGRMGGVFFWQCGGDCTAGTHSTCQLVDCGAKMVLGGEGGTL